MRNKTNKLASLERNRKSILTDNLDYCYICNQFPVDMHEIYSGSNRQVSMKNDFCVPLCRDHHRLITTNVGLNVKLKQLCQRKYEETHSREDFISLIGKSYLE